MVLPCNIKTKIFINLCYHRNDFTVATERQFFAKSHGKGACDGIWGTERLARKGRLQNSFRGTDHDRLLSSLSTVLLKASAEKHYCLKRGSRKLRCFRILKMCVVLGMS
jgi:hypothetical protein